MSENKHLVPICIVYLDGVRLQQKFEGALQSVTVIDPLNNVGSCTLTFDYADFKTGDTKSFQYDTTLSVHMGYKDDTKEVFSGEITKLSIDLDRESPSQFHVTALTCLQRLDHGQHNRTFENMTPSQAVKNTLERYNIQTDCESFGTKRAYWREPGRSDLELVLGLAKKYGRDVHAFGNKVYIKDLMTHMKEEVIYEWGKSLINFEAKIDIEEQANEINIIGWDTQGNKGVVSGAKISDVKTRIGGKNDWSKACKGGNNKWKEYINDPAVSDAAEAKELSVALMRERSFKLLRAEGSSEGNSRLIAGTTVTVKYVGPYSGEYIAYGVIHRFDLMFGYTTEFYLKRNMLEDGFQKGKASGSAPLSKNNPDNTKDQTENNTKENDNKDDEEDSQIIQKKEPNIIKIKLGIGSSDESVYDEKYILSSDDGSYYKELYVKDYKTESDDEIILEFEDVEEGCNYSLKVVYGSSGESSWVFENIPYRDLI